MKNVWIRDGVIFKYKKSRPEEIAGSEKPVRVLITPLDKITGQKISKRQLREIDSDEPVEDCLRGKSVAQIKKDVFPAAADKIISEMVLNHLIPGRSPTQKHDLGQLAESEKDEFFDLHAKCEPWQDVTVEKYRAQYEIMSDSLTGVIAETLDAEQYKQLQIAIIMHAFETSREDSDDWEYGEELPPSARDRIGLLYLLLTDLKELKGIAIPAKITRYQGRASREKQLLTRTDHVRHFPPEDLAPLYRNQDVVGGAIMNDCGLRISECCGLLWNSLRCICGSQGRMYYLQINGQTRHDGIRTEITKTDAGYRYVILSRPLGERLFQRRKMLAERYGKRIYMMPMCSQEVDGQLIGDAKTVAAYKSRLEDSINEVLRTSWSRKHQEAFRLIEYNLTRQNQKIENSLSSHALRRDHCTRQHCDSNLELEDIYRQMGHVKSDVPATAWKGLTGEEIYKLCLQRYVSGTGQYAPCALKYDADGDIRAAEVSACNVDLVLKPGQSITVYLEDIEPLNNITWRANGLQVEVTGQMPRPETPVPYGVLTRPEMREIVDKHGLFDCSDGEKKSAGDSQ